MSCVHSCTQLILIFTTWLISSFGFLPFIILQNGVEEWRIMFWISAIVFTSATIFFWLFGSAETQPWNDTTHTKVPTDEERQINETTTKDTLAEETEENERL